MVERVGNMIVKINHPWSVRASVLKVHGLAASLIACPFKMFLSEYKHS